LGINDSGKIVGNYFDASDVEHGFLLDNGTYTTIDPPGAAFSSANSINSAGIIAGEFQDNNGLHGFVYDGVTYTTIDYPNGRNTEPGHINNANEVVGTFLDGSKFRGFKWVGGTYTTIDVPNALYTMVSGNDNQGHVVGVFSPSNGKIKNFIMNGKGAIRVVGYPFTPARMNDRKVVVGNAGTSGGKLDLVSGVFTTAQYPNSFFTDIRDINNHGAVVGYYQDTPSSGFHGLVWNP
jgi:hypothetical protein